jgi:sugar phosphate isomerase/epimerase
VRLGIFAKTFARPDVAATFDAVKEHGLACVQFNFSVAGLATLPERIDPVLADGVKHEAAGRGIELAALSATFNMIDPVLERRRDGLRRLRVLAETAARMQVPVLTLCTGTRDPADMWRWHPSNGDRDAWSDLLAAMREAAAIAREAGIALAFEPEAANVVDSASKARRLLDELESPEVGVVIDPANLVPRSEVARMGEIVEEALDLLGPAVLVAHAKDIARDEGSAFGPAGQGLLDFPEYIRLLARSSFTGPLILHSLEEADVDAAVALLRAHLPAAPGASASR